MDLDVTLFLMLALVCALVALLRPLLARPLLAVMHERHQQTVGVRLDVRQMQKLTHVDEETLEARLKAARHQAHMAREVLRQTGRDQAREVLVQARTELLEGLQAHRQITEADEADARLNLNQLTEEMASSLTKKLLAS